LIITENQLFRQNVNATYLIEMNFKFSCCGYETSSIIQQFHPDYIIIDESMVNSSSDEICKHLLKDPRAHGSQIILAVSEYQISKKLPEGVCASIRVPFYDSDMEECILNLRNEFFGQNQIRQNSDSNNLK
jgi:CheY-like chemotaxis protein